MEKGLTFMNLAKRLYPQLHWAYELYLLPEEELIGKRVILIDEDEARGTISSIDDGSVYVKPDGSCSFKWVYKKEDFYRSVKLDKD